MKQIYYQPREIGEGSVDMTKLPDELYPHEGFASIEDCKLWLEANGYDLTDWTILRFEDEDYVDILKVKEDDFFSEKLYNLIMGKISAEEFRNAYGNEIDYDAMNGIINVGNNTIITNEN